MRLLIVLMGNFPSRLDSGGQQAVFHMVDKLRHKMHISILYDAGNVDPNDNEKLQRRWNNVNFYPYKVNALSQYRPSFLNLVTLSYRIIGKVFKKSSQVTKYKQLNENVHYSKDFLEKIKTVIQDENIEIVQTEFFSGSFLVNVLPDSVKKVFIQHEIRYVRNKQFLNKRNDVNALDLYCYKRQKNEEISTMNQYDAVVTLTDHDREFLLKQGVTSSLYSSPAIIPCFVNKLFEFVYDETLVFVGGYGHPPNHIGFLWFLKNVWGNVLTQKPNLKLNVIGRWPKKVKRQLEKKYSNLEFKGYVPDLYTAIRNSIMIVPLLDGSGMRMKIIEAANAGCPVITTTVGVEGIDLIDGESCLVADNVEDMIQSILELTSNVRKLNKLRCNAFNVIKEKYSEKLMVERRFNIYKELVENS